jgi:hypothetical protein
MFHVEPFQLYGHVPQHDLLTSKSERKGQHDKLDPRKPSQKKTARSRAAKPALAGDGVTGLERKPSLPQSLIPSQELFSVGQSVSPESGTLGLAFTGGSLIHHQRVCPAVAEHAAGFGFQS